MELIDQSQKSLYEKCKYKVKFWEHNFKKENGRLPSKLDIKEADPEVRNAYKTYFQLKTAALEQSFMDVEGFNSDEENDSLNTVQVSSNNDSTLDPNTSSIPESVWGLHLNKTPLIETPLVKPESSPNMNLKITRKLSMGSKLVKRNPRKSLSQVKSESSLQLSSEKPTETPTINKFFSQPTESSSIEDSKSIEWNLESESLTHFKFKSVKVKPTHQFVSSQPTNLLYNIEENRINNKLKDVNIDWLKRIENVNESKVTKMDVMSDEDVISNSDDESNNVMHIAKKIKFSSIKSVSNSSNNSLCNLLGNNSFEQIENSKKTCEKSSPTNDSKSMNITESRGEQSKFNEKYELEKNSAAQDSTINVNTNHVQQEKKKETITQVKKTYDQEDELSVRFKNKNLNENFVKINIKKKVYVRGKKTQTFSKFKKKMWRNKKAALAQEDGSYVGRGKPLKSDKLLPLDSVLNEDEDNLLTLDQATRNDNPNIVEDENIEEDNMTIAQLKIHYADNKNKGEEKKEKINKELKSKVNTKLNKKSVSENKKTQKKPSAITHLKSAKANSNNSNVGSDNEQSQFNEYSFDDDDDADLLLETLRVEEELKLKDVTPLYKLKEDGSLIETPSEVYDALRLFGHDSFRDGQEQAIMRILSGQSTLVTLSTGSGKSLCYQLPAYLFRQKFSCITLVISPLISLMEDQIKCIPGLLTAACLHGHQTKTQKDAIIKAVIAGDVSILMVSPESIMSSENSSGFGSVLARLPPIAFACLDEAHCLSQWSHNFRPSYLVVCRILQETLGIKTMLGLTATATKTTRISLIDQLKLPDGESGIIKDTPVPPNLSLSVSRDYNKDQALLELLLSEPFVNFKSIIIYCLRRDECEKVAAFLRTTLKYDESFNTNSSNAKKRKRMSLQAEPYHAGLSGARRKSIQKAFMCGDLRIVVATIAFGMGINKSDLRSVIHYNMPAKFESYVQEIGRAGRDLLPAHCHVFLHKENNDVFELRRHIYGNTVDRHIIRKLLRKVFSSCDCEGVCPKHEIMFSMDSTMNALDVPKEIISTLLCYLELHEKKYIKILRPSYGKCKILSYGGGALFEKAAVDSEPLKLALKSYKSDEKNSNVLEFPILNIARKLNYDSGILKRMLKNLEWVNLNGAPKRSALTVEYSDLSFHLLSPGNLPDEDLDEVLDSLYRKVLDQENTAYSQLIHINKTLEKVASKTFKESLTSEKSELLKCDIRDYFESENPLPWIEIPDVSESDRCMVMNDVHSIISRYSDESFTGRTIARIFHGIASPNYPPFIWGKTKYWRSHLGIHFNVLCKIATAELIKIHKV